MLASNTAVKCSVVEIPSLHCIVTRGGDDTLLSPVFSILDGDKGCFASEQQSLFS